MFLSSVKCQACVDISQVRGFAMGRNPMQAVKLEAVRWADVVCKVFCQIRNLAMGRIGVQEVLSV